MQQIKWREHDKTENLCEIVFDSPIHYPQMTLKEGTEKYLRDYPFRSQQEKYQASSMIKTIKDIYKDHDQTIGTLSYQVLKKSIEKRQNDSYALHTKSELSKMLRYLSNGSVPVPYAPKPSEPSKPSDEDVPLKLSSLPISELNKIMPIETGTGRFEKLKLLLYRHLQTLPKNEFGVIEVPKNTEPSEIKKISLHLSRFLKKQGDGWLMKWNPVDRIFMIARKTDWGGK